MEAIKLFLYFLTALIAVVLVGATIAAMVLIGTPA